MRSTFAVLVTVLAALSAPPARAFEDCGSAFPLSVDSSLSGFSLVTFTDSLAPTRTCTGTPGEKDIWAVLTAPSDGWLHLEAADANLSLYGGTCAAPVELSCLVQGENDAVFLTSGATYYLQLSAPPSSITYTAYFCGDGVPNSQECDDGNLVDTDACTNACAFNACGDGSLHIGVEECDDGNVVAGDACTDDCTDAECGDGDVWIGIEECDDGNATPGDGCEPDCTIGPYCGDGILNGGEECDDGNGSNTDACTNACLDAECGDGHVQTGIEQCDDGNAIGSDGCENDCRISSEDQCTNPATLFGAPSLNFLNNTGATTDPGDPIRTCTGVQGDNNVWATFAVPPGESGRVLVMVAGTKLTSAYTGACGSLTETLCQSVTPPPLTPVVAAAVSGGETITFEFSGPESGFGVNVSVCGNGTVDFPIENCDDGNAVDLDACSNHCRAPACGDGQVQMGEQCDDGNLVNGDGCEDDCFVTSVCGDGDVEGHETCDDGNVIDGDGCDADCRLPCPDNLCKCLGAANQFAVVGSKLGVKSGKFSGGGEVEYVPNEIDGSICGVSGTFGAKPGGETDVGGDLVLTRPDGTAGNFKGYKEDGVPWPGTYLLGDLLTGGGAVKGPLGVEVGGVTDTSGAHPLVPACTQARLDVAAAATTLAALTPNQTIPEIALAAGEEQTVVVGGGRQVVSIGSIKLKGYTGELDPALLTFQMGPATDVLIINVASLYLGPGAELLIEEGGNGAYAVVNLGPDGKASIKKEAFLGAPLIGTGSLTVPDGAFTDAVFTAGGVKIQGAAIESSLECEE